MIEPHGTPVDYCVKPDDVLSDYQFGLSFCQIEKHRNLAVLGSQWFNFWFYFTFIFWGIEAFEKSIYKTIEIS